MVELGLGVPVQAERAGAVAWEGGDAGGEVGGGEEGVPGCGAPSRSVGGEEGFGVRGWERAYLRGPCCYITVKRLVQHGDGSSYAI